jgi:hypothetical protein
LEAGRESGQALAGIGICKNALEDDTAPLA